MAIKKRKCAYCGREVAVENAHYHKGTWAHPGCVGLKAQLLTGVGIVSEDGVLHSLEKPARHFDVIRNMRDAGYPTPIRGDQGFILGDGSWVGRRAAFILAERTAQLNGARNTHSRWLFSEGVW